MEAVWCQSGLAWPVSELSFDELSVIITVPVPCGKFIRWCLRYASNVVDLEDVNACESAACAAWVKSSQSQEERLAAISYSDTRTQFGLLLSFHVR